MFLSCDAAAFVVATLLYHRYWLPKYQLLPSAGLHGEGKEEETPVGGDPWEGSASHRRQPSHELPGVSTPNQEEGQANSVQRDSGRGRMAAAVFNVECSV